MRVCTIEIASKLFFDSIFLHNFDCRIEKISVDREDNQTISLTIIGNDSRMPEITSEVIPDGRVICRIIESFIEKM